METSTDTSFVFEPLVRRVGTIMDKLGECWQRQVVLNGTLAIAFDKRVAPDKGAKVTGNGPKSDFGKLLSEFVSSTQKAVVFGNCLFCFGLHAITMAPLPPKSASIGSRCSLFP